VYEWDLEASKMGLTCPTGCCAMEKEKENTFSIIPEMYVDLTLL
jgi:hypothetical protein